MAAEIATLGIKVDSSGAVTALDKFAAATKPATAGASALEKAAANASAGVSNLGKAGVASKAGSDAIVKHGSAARYELINLSRQAQDVVVSLQGGQGLFTVLLQQGSQIGDVFASSKTATFGGVLKQIGTAVGPARALGLGLAAVAAGGAIAFKSLADDAKGFDDLTRSIGTTSGSLHALQSAAAFKGISADDFAKGMSRFGQAVYDAKNNMGGLADVFQANNVRAKTFNDYLFKAADLIKNSRDDQQRLQLLQQMGLPATMQWVRYLSQGADGIRSATGEAIKFNETAEGKLVAGARAFDEAWDKATTNVSSKFKQWGLGAYEWLDGIVNRSALAAGSMTRALAGVSGQDNKFALLTRQGSALTANSNVDALYAGTALAKQSTTVDPAALARRNAIESPLLGLLGQTPIAAPKSQSIEPPKEDHDIDPVRYSEEARLRARRDRRSDLSARRRGCGVWKQGDDGPALARRGDVRGQRRRGADVRLVALAGIRDVG